MFVGGGQSMKATSAFARAVVALLWIAAGAAAEEDENKAIADEEIIVTGSRIRRKDLTGSAPVTVITREQIETSGKASIGEFIQALPMQGNALNTQVNNGG